MQPHHFKKKKKKDLWNVKIEIAHIQLNWLPSLAIQLTKKSKPPDLTYNQFISGSS